MRELVLFRCPHRHSERSEESQTIPYALSYPSCVSDWSDTPQAQNRIAGKWYAVKDLIFKDLRFKDLIINI